MQDGLGLFFLENLAQGSSVGDIRSKKPEILVLELLQPVALQLDRVVVGEVVDADHLVAAREQPLRAVHADEAGDAGHQDLHFSSALRSSISLAYFM